MGLISGIAGLFQAGKQRRLAKKINPVNTTYEESPYIQQLYGEGRNLYQGRMAGAGAAEQKILTNQANTLSTVENNATDASQVLQTAAGVQGQTDEALSNLAVDEAKNKVGRFGVLSNVSQLMQQEGEKVYNDKLRKYYDDLNYKRALEGAADQNTSNFWQGLDDTAELAVSAFAPGGVLAGGGGGVFGRTGRNKVRQPSRNGYVPTQTI